MVSSGYMIMSHCQYNFPTVSPVFSVLSCPDFNIFMANDRVEWGMGQWNKSTIHSFIATFMSLSKALLASESWDFAVSGWAESDEKDMWWNAGNLITGSLPTETQPAYLLSQGTSNLHWLSWFFPGAFNKLFCPDEIRSQQTRICIYFSILEHMSLFPNPHC